MTSPRMRYTIALAVCWCFFLSACDKAKENKNGIQATHDLYIKIDAGQNCSQQLDNGGYVVAPVNVPPGDSVNFHALGPDGSAADAFTITFPNNAPSPNCGSPFQYFGCSSSFSSAATTGGQVGNENYPYNSVSITVKGQAQMCNNPRGLGLIMKP
jgi:hypothetical protein